MKKEQKALAKYLIVTAMIDLCSFYYVAGYFAKFLINHVTGTSSDGFKLAMGLTNLTFYLLFIAAFVFFYKKIVGCIDKMITATFYLWGVLILSNPDTNPVCSCGSSCRLGSPCSGDLLLYGMHCHNRLLFTSVQIRNSCSSAFICIFWRLV